MQIISIIGARPQFVKAAVVSRALRQRGDEILVHTGQHYDGNMSDIFFTELGLPVPDINLGVGSGTHAQQTSAMMVGIEKVLLEQQPDWVLVYGDTNSTLAGALAASKLNLRLAHVEAGLRSFNRQMPEEVNRVVTDALSNALFCPTQVAVENLAREGVTAGVHVVGDVMLDALMQFLTAVEQPQQVLKTLLLEPGHYALLTVHRAANTDDPQRLRAILNAVGKSGMPVIFPAHPRTRQIIDRLEIALPDNIRMIEPVGYLDMIQLERNADCILTDSGGMQKEAYWLGVRCITLREETEWVETVQTGWNRLTGANEAEIVAAVRSWKPVGPRPPVYGDGRAAEQIAAILFEEPVEISPTGDAGGGKDKAIQGRG